MNNRVRPKHVGRNKSHRAVAPIIATLLMVAIAVVGGVMIYVFTQGFFKGTSTSTPTTDVLSVTGYDMKSATVFTYEGTTGGGGVSASATGLSNGDIVAIDIKNAGTNAIKITSVKVAGIGAAFSSGAAPTAAGWGLRTGSPAAWSTDQMIAPNAPATIIFKLPASGVTGVADYKAGVSASVSIVTANGEFSQNAVIGERH